MVQGHRNSWGDHYQREAHDPLTSRPRHTGRERLKVSGMTPEQLEEKARTRSDTLKEAECHLLTHGYHI